MSKNVSWKTKENVKDHKDMTLVASSKKYAENMVMYFKRVISFRNPKTEVKMKNAVYPEYTILDLTKIFLNGFPLWLHASSYGSKLNQCCINKDSFLCGIETECFYKVITEEVEAKFDTNRFSKWLLLLLTEKSRKVIGMMEN